MRKERSNQAILPKLFVRVIAPILFSLSYKYKFSVTILAFFLIYFHSSCSFLRDFVSRNSITRIVIFYLIRDFLIIVNAVFNFKRTLFKKKRPNAK